MSKTTKVKKDDDDDEDDDEDEDEEMTKMAQQNYNARRWSAKRGLSRAAWGASTSFPHLGGAAYHFRDELLELGTEFFSERLKEPVEESPERKAMKQELEQRVADDAAARMAHAENVSTIWRYAMWLLDRVQVLARAMQLLAIFSPCIATLPAWLLVPDDWVKVRPDWWFELLVHSLQLGGPTFIKLGQWASTRADLFGPRLRRNLRVLHDNVGLESMRATRKTLREAGSDSELVEFSEKPIGSGCIAQVHLARMANSGDQVAVKIQRHNVRRTIEHDLALMRAAVSIINYLLPRNISEVIGLRESSELFAEFMTVQMDFNQEGLNLMRFQDNFQETTLPVHFPQPVAVSKNGTVLVETFEAGTTLSKLLEGEESDGDAKIKHIDVATRKRIGGVGVKTFLKMVLLDNLCHSDLHPGNILVRFKDNNELDSISFIDGGLTTTLSEKNRINFIDLFAAVATGNGRLAGELMVERADPERIRLAKDPDAFIDGIESVVSRVQLDSFRLDRVKIGSVLEQVLNLVREHQVPIDPSFTNLILSIIVLEGIGRNLDPALDIFKESLPILFKVDRKMKIAALRALGTSTKHRIS
ncbi:ABC1 family protein YPL109C, mitochondrial [Hondaea fermentalgiana]|uniref:ABC1 family protein YPL109C, mitochondrial n=1 Tax=Hondaea fermentalgiana TaxID=2315210 RepID=A0A2R5G656_9STRA|nr:ABC1 family protein YPL109C, mitochondrial [Hondaea fermentalgiana]|eukprot:GBG25809.1 ABC1 family protein YPL109C, mitochondrial [Hondaea fermentalgiana]